MSCKDCKCKPFTKLEFETYQSKQNRDNIFVEYDKDDKNTIELLSSVEDLDGEWCIVESENNIAIPLIKRK